MSRNSVTPDKPPLVLHVIHHLVIGGMENSLINLIQRMPKSRFRHAIACIEDYSEFRRRLTRDDVEVFALHRSRNGLWKVRRDLLRLCRHIRPAILHSRNISGLDALLPARLAGVRYCVHGEHGWDVNDLHGNRWKPAMLRRIHAPLVDHYITVSKHLERYLAMRVGISTTRISQIYNGVDTDRFSASSQKPTAVLPSHFPKQGLVVIGTVGRIQPVKDQATLIRAFAELLRMAPDLTTHLRLAIIGDGPLLAGLRDLAKSLGIAELIWLPGALSNIPEILRVLDVFVLPSLSEGISNTVLEAMASGLPVVATNVGGNPELVDHQLTGLLVPPSDPVAMAEGIRSYLLDRSKLLSHGQAGLMKVQSRFSMDAMVRGYLALYDSLLDAKTGPERVRVRDIA